MDVFDGILDPQGLVLRGEAQLREDKVGNQSFGVGLHHRPDMLILDTIR
jgi:hypothetical protein